MGFMAFLVIHLGLLFIKIKSGSSLAGKKEGLSSNSELSPGGKRFYIINVSDHLQSIHSCSYSFMTLSDSIK